MTEDGLPTSSGRDERVSRSGKDWFPRSDKHISDPLRIYVDGPSAGSSSSRAWRLLWSRLLVRTGLTPPNDASPESNHDSMPSDDTSDRTPGL